MLCAAYTGGRMEIVMLKRSEIRIRDPFILTDNENQCYYMYGTTDLKEGSFRTGHTFSVFKTYDLENFEEGVVVFDGSAIDFWADRDYWAPEVHKYKGKYYMFASFKAEDRHRATHILISDTPDGPFRPVSKDPQTPPDWECLDGTLWVEDGKPYMIFCHEWIQTHNGRMCAIELSEDLTRSVGEPFLLFTAIENADAGELEPNSGDYITDGPFLYAEDGRLKMLWSSTRADKKYMVLLAESDSIRGKWTQSSGNMFDFCGGHAMLFYTLDGKRMISMHSPNPTGLERALFLPY